MWSPRRSYKMNGAFRVGVRAGLAFRRCSPIAPFPDSCHGADYGISRLRGLPSVTPDVSSSDRREPRRVNALRSASQNNEVVLSETQPVPVVAYPPVASAQYDDKLAANAPRILDGDHPFSQFWRAYNKALDERPIMVKSATSFFGFLIGDIIAQNIVGLPFDYWRTVRLVLFGIFMDGPVGKLCWGLTTYSLQFCAQGPHLFGQAILLPKDQITTLPPHPWGCWRFIECAYMKA